MSKCVSCGRNMEWHETTSVVEVDGVDTVVPETFCTSCLDKYVYNVELLSDRFYNHETLIDPLYINFRKVEET